MMEPWLIWLLVGLVLSGIAFYFLSIAIAANRIYILTLKRRSKSQWGRALSIRDPQQIQMDEIGVKWAAAHADKKRDVHILHKGLNLYGEYYDFGSDRCVMILSGRTESLRYGYYFAKPYAESGLNVLVIDSRAHGLSDGEFNTVGFEESKDAVAWAKFLCGECGVKEIIFHGICIGAASGMLAITSPDCPPCVAGIVTEGMFANFGESMKNHLIERKRMWFPAMQLIDLWMRHYTGHSMRKGPIDFIGRLDKPLLMLQSKKDPYSTAELAKRMYDLCPSAQKELILFEEGAHSMLRITDTEKYDAAIKVFLKR